MNNVVFEETIRSFDQEKDIESPPKVYVTREQNGYAVFYCDDSVGTQLVKFFVSTGSRAIAIRFGIDHIDALRADA